MQNLGTMYNTQIPAQGLVIFKKCLQISKIPKFRDFTLKKRFSKTAHTQKHPFLVKIRNLRIYTKSQFDPQLHIKSAFTFLKNSKIHILQLKNSNLAFFNVKFCENGLAWPGIVQNCSSGFFGKLFRGLLNFIMQLTNFYLIRFLQSG